MTVPAWRAIVAAVERRIRDGSFGNAFPEVCREYGYTIGTDANLFGHALEGAVPNIGWPLNENQLPDRFGGLDLIQFCYANVAKPQQHGWHDYYRHYRLTFDVETGRREFRDEINGIFGRNGLAFELLEDGQLVRQAAPELQRALTAAVFNTGDNELNGLLDSARAKFMSPDPNVRKEALEKLWDAWERLKTLEYPADKLRSVGMLLDRCAAEPNFRATLDTEAKNLTNVGNNFMIRHTEVGKTPIGLSEHVDYLFHRLFALIRLALRTTGRGG